MSFIGSSFSVFPLKVAILSSVQEDGDLAGMQEGDDLIGVQEGVILLVCSQENYLIRVSSEFLQCLFPIIIGEGSLLLSRRSMLDSSNDRVVDSSYHSSWRHLDSFVLSEWRDQRKYVHRREVQRQIRKSHFARVS